MLVLGPVTLKDNAAIRMSASRAAHLPSGHCPFSVYKYPPLHSTKNLHTIFRDIHTR